jgi:hypothetical protein
MGKKLSLLVWVLPMFLAVSAIPHQTRTGETERLPDTNKILAAYGCIEKGKYNYGVYVVTKVSLLGDPDNISFTEGMKELLDTPEEFITASFYYNPPVMIEVREIIERELPRGKIGGLRLASLWLKKSAEDRDNSPKFAVAINIIRKKSGLTDAAIHEYFIRAMENEIMKSAAEIYGSRNNMEIIRTRICAPLLAYYAHPDATSEEDLINTGMLLFKEDRSIAEGYINTLIKLNDKFSIKIIRKIHDRRSAYPK